MKDLALGPLWLRARLALGRMNPVLAGGVLVLLGCAAALAWLDAARGEVRAQYDAARLLAARPAAPMPAPSVPSTDQNLARFHATLGERRAVDRQLAALFALAARHGLVLRQGEYRSSQDRAGGFNTYQLNLPLKGSYGAIWAFAFDALRALPHASLDDVSFRRDAIGEENVEARLRLTLYLSGAPGAAR